MTGTLSYNVGDKAHKVLCNSVLTIGRDKSNDVVLPDLLVSRNHAVIRRLGDGDYYLIDSGSSNGSRLNEQRIAAPTRLGDGDVIAIGRTQFVFTQDAQPRQYVDSLSFQDTVIVDSPVIKEITVLVADIRGFTSLSEQMPIQTLTKMMSKWFHDVSAVIYKNEGAVDKFIGDCVFARWEADEPRRNVLKAMKTAWLIGAVTERLSTSFPELPDKLRIGVGINTGKASVGIGADNTALGDAVNTAFRLESATKVLGVDVAMSASSFRYLPEQFWKPNQKKVRLRGKKAALQVCALTFSQLEAVLQSLRSG